MMKMINYIVAFMFLFLITSCGNKKKMRVKMEYI